MYRKTRFLLASLALLLSLGLIIQLGATASLTFDIPWFTFDGGGGHSSGANLELVGTVGQPDAGPMNGGSFSLSGGFWHRPYELVLTPDLSIDKVVTPTDAKPGDTITYTLTFQNSGTATATNVTITDVMPTEIVNTSVSSSGASINVLSGDNYEWEVADLAPDESGTITISGIVDPALSANATVNNTATISATEDGNAANNSAAAALQVTLATYNVYLPMIVNNAAQAPDLVVKEIVADDSSVQVTIENQGAAPVTDEFWVDLMINPTAPPTAVNQTWETQGGEGTHWGVEADSLPLDPGGTLVLTVGDARDFGGSFSGTIPAGATIYAHVDSANTNTTYGAVNEVHEITGTAYNNIESVTTSAVVVMAVGEETTTRLSTSSLPDR